MSNFFPYILLSMLSMWDFIKDNLVGSVDVFCVLESLRVTYSVIFCLKWSKATLSYLSSISNKKNYEILVHVLEVCAFCYKFAHSVSVMCFLLQKACAFCFCAVCQWLFFPLT